MFKEISERILNFIEKNKQARIAKIFLIKREVLRETFSLPL